MLAKTWITSFLKLLLGFLICFLHIFNQPFWGYIKTVKFCLTLAELRPIEIRVADDSANIVWLYFISQHTFVVADDDTSGCWLVVQIRGARIFLQTDEWTRNLLTMQLSNCWRAVNIWKQKVSPGYKVYRHLQVVVLFISWWGLFRCSDVMRTSWTVVITTVHQYTVNAGLKKTVARCMYPFKNVACRSFTKLILCVPFSIVCSVVALQICLHSRFSREVQPPSILLFIKLFRYNML